jgi:hypothetical protein
VIWLVVMRLSLEDERLLIAIMQGFISNKVIAKQLDKSRWTVKNQISRLNSALTKAMHQSLGKGYREYQLDAYLAAAILTLANHSHELQVHYRDHLSAGSA